MNFRRGRRSRRAALLVIEAVLARPATSTGDLLLRPLYYHIAPALWLAIFPGWAAPRSPVGVATIFLVWLAARDWFPAPETPVAQPWGQIHSGALAAAMLYAASPLAIRFARFSWNPNILPFWALLALYSAWRAWERPDFRWLAVSGIALAFALQSHYLAFLLFPTAGLFWLLALVRAWRAPGIGRRGPRSEFLLGSFFGSLAFLLLMSPLILFDARQGWSNLSTIPAQLSGGDGTRTAVQPGMFLERLGEAAGELVAFLFTGSAASPAPGPCCSRDWFRRFSVLLAPARSRWPGAAPYWLLATWILSGLAGLALYPGEIFDHYYALLFPAPFLLLGGAVQALQNKAVSGKRIHSAAYLLSLAAVAAILFVELANNPLLFPPERQLLRTEEVARKIAAEAGGQPLNLAVIAERNYADGYRYFLERWDIPVMDLDPERPKATRAGQLFIVCEQPRATCDPKHEPRAVVSKYGRSRVAGEWALAGVTLYRLVPLE
jgi:4-amino-4-deoxy-L-arabinose transferase-like glycosyltransferase